MTELGYVRGLCRRLRDKGVFVQRLEDMYSTGVPDMFIMYNGSTAFIEVKHSRNPVVRSRKIGLNPSQVAWLRKYANNGGTCYVAYRAGSTFRLFNGADSAELAKSLPLTELDAMAVQLCDKRHEVTAILDELAKGVTQ